MGKSGFAVFISHIGAYKISAPQVPFGKRITSLMLDYNIMRVLLQYILKINIYALIEKSYKICYNNKKEKRKDEPCINTKHTYIPRP